MSDTPSTDAVSGRYRGVRAYAAARDLNPGTVSRQIKKGVIPTHGVGAGGSYLIDPDEADRARAERLNPLKARGRGNGLGYEPSLLQAEAMAGERRSPGADAKPRSEIRPDHPTGRLATAHFAEKAVKAQLAQLDLEERLGVVCDRAGAEAAGRAVGALLKSALAARQRGLAERFAAMSDVNQILRALREADDAMLKALAEHAANLKEPSDEAA